MQLNPFIVLGYKKDGGNDILSSASLLTLSILHMKHGRRERRNDEEDGNRPHGCQEAEARNWIWGAIRYVVLTL